MAANPTSSTAAGATIAPTAHVSVRLPTELVLQLDRLCQLTERRRTYWVQRAVEALIPAELELAQAVADDHDAPDDLTHERMLEWMLANGYTTREAIERVEARHAADPGVADSATSPAR
jgi:predicted transcriptional regulator